MPKKGKKGVDQRVKGNVKTANSQRMAELLGGDVGGVIGFEAVSRRRYSESFRPAGMDNSELQVVLKQLGKRDTTTKLKALQEFGVMTYQFPPTATVAVLSVWSLMYNKLSMDNDNRVRDAAHRALKCVVEIVRGSLGAHLRNIMGCWVSGMSDPHVTAASSAFVAFSTAFPTRDKQVEVFQYGFKAIINHAAEMVLKNTPDSYSDTKVVPADERVQRYERAVIMAVCSIRAAFNTLSQAFILEKKKVWEDLLGDKKLWKLARHQNPGLRTAVFGLVPVVCLRDPDFVEAKGKLYSTSVLGSLGETEPTVVGKLWEAAIMIVSKTESWSDNVSIEKTVLPGVWSLLDGGGYGSAKITYPCLLPLLSKLVEKVYSADVQFATKFLDKLRSGLQLDRPSISRGEFEILITTFSECLLYLMVHLKLSHFHSGIFNKHVISMVLELVMQGLSTGPSLMQREVLFSHCVKITGKLLMLQDDIPTLRPSLSNFQLQLSKNISDVLKSEDDVKNNFARVGSLLKCIFSHSLWSAMERKTVSFTPGPQVPVRKFLDSRDNNYSMPNGEEVELKCDEATRDFIAPTICSLCSNSIAAVSWGVETQHAQLLLTMVRLYANKTLIRSVFSSLESNHSQLMREYMGEKVLKQKLLVICMVLVKGARLGEGLETHPHFTENIVEAVLLLLKCDLVDTGSSSLYLSELVQSSPAVLPLILVKLNETDQPELLSQLMQSCVAVFNSLLTNLAEMENAFYWKLLNILFSQREYKNSHFNEVDVFPFAFGSMCQILTKSLQEMEVGVVSLSSRVMKNVFKVIGEVRVALIQENEEAVIILLGAIQHWCIAQYSADLALVHSAIECYHNLLGSMPEVSTYIQSLPSLVMQQTPTSLQSTLVSAVMYFALHCHVMVEPSNLIKLYQPMLQDLHQLQGPHFPVAGLESFSTGNLLYSPLLSSNNTLNSTGLNSQLSPALLHSLFPVVAITSPTLLHQLHETEMESASTALQDGQSPQEGPSPSDVLSSTLSRFVDVCSTHSAIKSLLFGGRVGMVGEEGVASEAGVASEERKALDRMATSVITLMGLSISTLQPCQFKKVTTLESHVQQVLSSSLSGCLEVAVTNQEWLLDILQGLGNSLSVEGPVMLLVLHQIVGALAESCVDNIPLLHRIINAVQESAEGSGAVQSSLCGMDTSNYHQFLLGRLEEKGNDPCLLIDCLWLCPDDPHLISTCASCLSGVANNPDITIFNGIIESAQDPFCFTMLEMARLLLGQHKVPQDCWDFLLCSLVTLTQAMSEGEVTSSVNETVFLSRLLTLCHDVSSHFLSPHCHTEQLNEWTEFFLPSLQESLSAFFTKQSSPNATASRGEDPCLVVQHYHLCRAASSLSLPAAPKEGVALPNLVDVVVSPFYPQQATAYLLAKRALELYQIYDADEETPTSDGTKTLISVVALQDMFSKAWERIDMDSVFLEDSSAPAASEGNSHCTPHTTSYIFMWLLVIEAMGQCAPEIRVLMVEWLKELSLFEHFLHGLLKYLNEDTAKQKPFQVSWCPCLEQLACIGYQAVATHLPLMLRQWHLTLDRQTSAFVSGFTTKYISPALQKVELQEISRSQTSIGNMEVHVYTGASEVAVVYKVDEFSIELFVRLPDSYPLHAPSIREGRKVKVEQAQWRKWMLQLNIFVTNQNGSLLDGLMLWKNNLDRHFSGADDCLICFSVIHSSNYSLPKMVCKTCKKKFHSACLYKWFSTSTKSSCPLCRNIF